MGGRIGLEVHSLCKDHHMPSDKHYSKALYVIDSCDFVDDKDIVEFNGDKRRFLQTRSGRQCK